ncbi:hypothetical protein PY254_11685 [Rhodanobacter sp. AS-Z3]|uniref:hypothetical protein n=1 Tax=Rhodanobacter sp. AS-Z3 TaxID=3031330 RepID=UPI002479E808|nr:hypothetical protein [Rhodanobacter sp. AS-Z3]WEN13901.1 hypothetical protein PY254_11685 [Rhodanobacter sp. AS-Z3]
MFNRNLFYAGALLIGITFTSMVTAQESGIGGFLHRAGAVVKASAGQVLGQPTSTQNPSGVAVTTTGDYFRPTHPASGGEFQGLFNHWKQGDAWPRASVYFTEYGSALPCWNARATIWRSASSHHEETFQVCNAPIVVKDDMGNTAQIAGFPLDGPLGTQFFIARNVPGISHADTAPSRNAGPNPPAAPFGVNIAGLEGTRIRPMYDDVVIRLAWVTGYMTHDGAPLNTLSGKSLWVAGFDPAGNHDAH